ncbi:conserved hypothetical protein, partial [Ricinus communis]
ALGDVRRERHVHARHRVRVVIVVDDGRVLVRSRHGVDAEAAGAVVAADARPDAGRLQHDFCALLRHEVEVVRRQQVQADRVRDVRVDVVLRRPGREVGGALLARDRAPRVQRAFRMRHLACAFACLRQAVVAVLQQRARDLGTGVQEEREHIDFRIPEIVALVAFARHALGRDVRPAVAADGLQQVELVEVHALLQGVVAGDGHVRVFPEARQVVGLFARQRVEAGGAGCRQLGARVRTDGVGRHVARARVRDVFVQGERGALLHVRVERVAQSGLLDACGARRHGIRRGGQGETAVTRALQQQDVVRADVTRHLDQRRARQRGTDARIVARLQVRHVRVDVRDDADKAREIQRRDGVFDGGDVLAAEGDEAAARDAHTLAGGGLPLDRALEQAGAEVQRALPCEDAAAIQRKAFA